MRRNFQALTRLNASPKLGRMSIVNHFNQMASSLAPTTNYPRLSAFLPQNLLPWASKYLKSFFTPRIDFPTYAGSSKTGVYAHALAPGQCLRLAIAGDWGTGTEQAQKIATLMTSEKPDYTIHLGDIYYAGDTPEIMENCFGIATNGYDGVIWPHGSKGSFALNGNHEMYAKGGPYFNVFLKKLGMTGDQEGQVASFFSLETDSWRIIGLDTGYNCVGKPILSWIPGINSIPSVGGDCHLEEDLIQWIDSVVRPGVNKKRTVLLSHHEYFTAFNDSEYTKPAQQLNKIFKNDEVVWLWGHEHRMAIYDKLRRPELGGWVHGRCIGHAGMPVEVSAPNVGRAPVIYYDKRTHSVDGTSLGYNGYVVATICDSTLTLEYKDIESNLLYKESFASQNDGTLVRAYTDYGFQK